MNELEPSPAPPTYGPLNPRPHPFLEVPSVEEILAMCATEEGKERWLRFYNRREKLITLSETPGMLLDHAFELDCWKDADRDLAMAQTDGRDYGGEYVGGGKRSSKSTWAARTVLRSALTYAGGIIWVFQGSMTISRITVQRLLWEWMPKWLRDKNDVSGKRKNDDVTKIRYTPDGGFAGDNLVLPNETQIMFLSYEQEPRNYQGAEIGARIRPTAQRTPAPWISEWLPNGIALDKHGQPIPNIGAWMDEDATLAWVGTVRDRMTTRNSKFIWTFTTENGITLAVKTLVGAGENIETREVDDTLPSDRVLVPGCPVGRVPYRQRTTTAGVNAIYFHTRFNRFGTNYANMAAQYRGRDSKQILANLFGYSEDMQARAFPLFGGHNIIDRHQLPAAGTNYLIADPAGSRNFAFIWLRVASGMDGDNWYIFDEWPDAQTYGEWALPDDSAEPNPDGVRGPAQRSLGWGIEQYKQMIAKRQRVLVTAAQVEQVAREGAKDAKGGIDEQNIASRFWPDPMARELVLKALGGGELAPEGLDLALPVRERYLDPRAGNTPQIQDRGGKSLVDKFLDVQKDAQGNVTGPSMYFRLAPGFDVERGIQAINDLLYFDKEQELVPGLNYPRLFVVRSCRQSIWMLENFTNQGGEKGGCRDFADLLRYAATSSLRYVAPGAVQVRGGGRSY